MTDYKNISVAVPWSLSHYIPLNGFHPLYRALFDSHPENITINAWDNIELSKMLRVDSEQRTELLNAVSVQHKILKSKISSDLAAKYLEGYFPPNIALTSLLSGDIEFHHTAPFPSLTRPFVFHCESFAPLFFPFYQQGKGEFLSSEKLRSHYLRILSDPLCLGIFSHIPETLRDISHFFNSPAIDAKLHPSRIGLSSQSLPKDVPEKRWPVSTPRFLFVNSANQNPANFFHRGGHVVLRFWREFIALGCQGKLYLRCARPSDELLSKHGVDITFLHREESSSVIWIQDYLTNQELNALMSDVHFFLIPSASLHSVSIMQAMASGTVPIVSDTIGTSLYVKDGHNGIVLEGVFSANWKKDPVTGVLVDNYHRNQALDDSLVAQLLSRVVTVLAEPCFFYELRKNALFSAYNQFSGHSFSDDFWVTVQTLFTEHISNQNRSVIISSTTVNSLERCLLDKNDWPRIFESVPNPITRIYTGYGWVTELGGNFIHTRIEDPARDLHEWSVLAVYCKKGAPCLNYAISIKKLGGRFLSHTESVYHESHLYIIKSWVSRLLMPYSRLHRLGARSFKIARKVKRSLSKQVDPVQKIDDIHDIQLIKQTTSGMNVIRYFDKYYAIPQNEGAFLIEKANSSGYSVCFFGNSAEEVLLNVAESSLQTESFVEMPEKNIAPLELIEEGFYEFNIIRFIDRFYALPQSEGNFQYNRFLSGRYDRIYCSESVAAVKAEITRYRK